MSFATDDTGTGQQGRILAERVLEAREAERSQLCRRVHDGVLQSIIASRLLLNRVLEDVPSRTPFFDELAVVDGCLVQAIKDGRDLMEELRPVTADEISLTEAVQLFLMRKQTETEVKFEFVDRTTVFGLGFPVDIRSNLYRVVQESVRNVIKHSRSKHARVTVGRSGEQAWAHVQDWGVGFGHERIESASSQGGLASLRRRAELLGGICEIQSSPGEGTSIKVTAPLIKDAQEAFSSLRARAQAILLERSSDSVAEALAAEMDTQEVAALLHEFEVQRVELEIQNRQLGVAQTELDVLRASCRDLYEDSSTGYLELDSDDRILHSNPAFHAMVGLSPQALLDKTLDSLLVRRSDTEQGAERSCEAQLRRTHPPGWFSARLEQRAPSGHRRWVAVTALST